MAHVSRNVFGRIIAYDPYLIDGDFPAQVDRVHSLHDLIAQVNIVSPYWLLSRLLYTLGRYSSRTRLFTRNSQRLSCEQRLRKISLIGYALDGQLTQWALEHVRRCPWFDLQSNASD